MSDLTVQQSFLSWLHDFVQVEGHVDNEDLVGLCLPLIKQVIELHEDGTVAPVFEINKLFVSHHHLWFLTRSAQEKRVNPLRIQQLDAQEQHAIKVNQEWLETDAVIENLAINTGTAITQPVYLNHYDSWENRLGHHDELTDIFGLGMIICSIACKLDLSDQVSLQRFVSGRQNLFAFNAGLHPVLVKLLIQMTALSRHQRIQDLNEIQFIFENYRTQASDEGHDWNNSHDYQQADDKQQQTIVLSHLRNRLFEISRRNKLVYFKPTLGSLNLTEASVPVLLDYEHIRSSQLFIWHQQIAKKLMSGKPLALDHFLRFEDAAYIPGTLTRILAEERRNRHEYGFSTLRLVLVFLRWHNLKDNPDERIVSPLLLLPVNIKKKTGVKDKFTIAGGQDWAEVNPVLRHHLSTLYNITLPEIVPLDLNAISEFYNQLMQVIQGSEPGITLRFMDKPEIKIIHKRAKARLDQYQRKHLVTGRGVKQYDEDINYCYHHNHFQPLGLQLFSHHVKPEPSPLQLMLLAQHETGGIGDDVTIESQFYVLDKHESSNPYHWGFDLCHCVLGHFNYRKMSLIRDYNLLLDQDKIESTTFARLFSAQPKPQIESLPSPPIEQSYFVVANDPTQAATISHARGEDSFVIQGPPGTGKSQTITNLIADFIARQQRVLFVCEKRAAIDVVYYRLKQQHLDALCCLIHDSQDDKKAFIADLKSTYNYYLENEHQYESVLQQRAAHLDLINRHLSYLEKYNKKQTDVLEKHQCSLRDLIARAIHLNIVISSTQVIADDMPTYRGWQQHGNEVVQLHQVLQKLAEPVTFGAHPFRLLAPLLFKDEVNHQKIKQKVNQLVGLIQNLIQSIPDPFPLDPSMSFTTLGLLITCVNEFSPLIEHQLLPLLDDKSVLNAYLQKNRNRKKQLGALTKQQHLNRHWRQKISEEELDDALSAIDHFENDAFRFFKPGYWQMWRVLNRAYDFGAHQIKPTWKKIIEKLRSEYEMIGSLKQLDQLTETETGFSNVEALLSYIKDIKQQADNRSEGEAAFIQLLLNEKDNARHIKNQMLFIQTAYEAIIAEMSHLNALCADMAISILNDQLNQLIAQFSDFPLIVPEMKQLVCHVPELYQLMASLPLTPDQVESLLVEAALTEIYRDDREIRTINSKKRDVAVKKISVEDQLLKLSNAKVIKSLWHERFLNKVNQAGLPASQLDKEQKDWKKTYHKGRRILEHEFGKVMRYKSIRELFSSESGEVVMDLKPVWLMSPLSVSDTLPLTEQFDVVVFDEASQIPLEEAIPSLFRGPKTIVVGDQQQLPPSDFFAAKTQINEALQDADEIMTYGLEADSFLNYSANRLPATMLGWHYRSHSESLISFSNATFYHNTLLTIPDQKRIQPQAAINTTQEMALIVRQLFDRPVTFHYLANGIYSQRKNTKEANYIARMIQQLLISESHLTIGVVAFSEAQQGEIETALEQLAAADKKFRDRLEVEYEREAEDQFCGLFIKNLENVQGDERDIIIVSICYGPDQKNKMKMNFGPINRSGGEKRLNVIFSRARQHMVVVSSIRYDRITNDYNDGALCLKRYLQYAQAMSVGDLAQSSNILKESHSNHKTQQIKQNDEVITSMVAAFKAQDWLVDTHVGRSHFKCDIALRKTDVDDYQLGVLVDHHLHYQNHDLNEQYVLKPKILVAFGWQILTIHAKDWLDDRKGVIKLMCDLMRE